MTDVQEIRNICKKLNDVYRKSICGPEIVSYHLERTRFVRKVYECLGKDKEEEDEARQLRDDTRKRSK